MISYILKVEVLLLISYVCKTFLKLNISSSKERYIEYFRLCRPLQREKKRYTENVSLKDKMYLLKINFCYSKKTTLYTA